MPKKMNADIAKNIMKNINGTVRMKMGSFRITVTTKIGIAIARMKNRPFDLPNALIKPLNESVMEISKITETVSKTL